MASSTHSRPGRALIALLVLFAALFGSIAAGTIWGTAQWSPKLALDLEGGVEIVLKPVPLPGTSGQIDANSIARAVEIIRQRVNGSGVSEAEVTTQGGQNIVVSLPGHPDEKTLDLVKQAAQLEFRAVLVAQQGIPTPTTTPTPSTTGSPGTTPSPSGTAKPSASATPSTKPSASLGAATPTAKTNGMAMPAAVREALALPKAAGSTTVSPTATTATTGSPKASTSPAASTPATPPKPTDASDTNWIDQAIYEKFIALDCTNPKNRQGGEQADPKKPLVTCSVDGAEKYILGPAELLGTDVASANAGLTTDSRGNVTGQWQVQLKFTGDGTEKFATVTTRLAKIDKNDARNRFGIVLDDLVISAPTTNEPIVAGDAQITGNFTQATATNLANQLKFGALPVTFRVDTQQQISALLGREQLERGLLAGLIGLVLVVLYSLAQYRLLGLVTVFSLGIAGGLTFGTVALLGWTQGYRLSLPGVTGLIVAIGITADSFIVFFERVRDEVREGRGLLAAVEVGWQRARRTILASDAVSFLAALTLYVLAVGSVQGFAFTLGLTTLIDVVVVFLFTKPVVTLLARTKFFGQGHPWSGFDAAHLGRDVRYAGRGRVRTQAGGAEGRQTIAQRRAAAAEAGADDEPRNGSEIAEAGAGRAAGARRES